MIGTKMYNENKAWIESLKNKGYNIFDIGDPLRANDIVKSPFYDVETMTLWGELFP